jgi:hypothetical protein
MLQITFFALFIFLHFLHNKNPCLFSADGDLVSPVGVAGQFSNHFLQDLKKLAG